VPIGYARVSTCDQHATPGRRIVTADGSSICPRRALDWPSSDPIGVRPPSRTVLSAADGVGTVEASAALAGGHCEGTSTMLFFFNVRVDHTSVSADELWDEWGRR
jgi:hypothetical protein